MTRDRELAYNYQDMANMAERFKEKRIRLEGNWFLIEEPDIRHQIVTQLADPLVDAETFRRSGFTVTPLIIFKNLD